MNDPTDMCEDFVSTLTGVVRTCEDSRNIYYTTTTFFFLQLTLNNIQGPHSPHHYEKSPHKVLTKSSQVLTHPQKCTQKCTKLWM